MKDGLVFFFFFNDTATTEIYTTANTLSLHDALPISSALSSPGSWRQPPLTPHSPPPRSEEHTSELQSLAVISYAVFCLKKKKTNQKSTNAPLSCIQHTAWNNTEKC